MNVDFSVRVNSPLLGIQSSSSSSVSNEEAIPESIVDRLSLDRSYEGQKYFTVTDLSKAKEILLIPRNSQDIVNESANEEGADSVDFDRLDFSALIAEYLKSKFENRHFIYKAADSIFTCSQYRNEDFHIFIARNFFNPTCLSFLPERSADLATKMVLKGGANYARNSDFYAEYAERGVIELLKDKDGNDLITAMRKEGCPDIVCLLLFIAAVGANTQIGAVIDAVLIVCKKDRELRSRISSELRSLRQTMPLWKAASESSGLRSLIYEALRTSSSLTVERETRTGERIHIDLGSSMPFDANRFAAHSTFAPGLPHLPFGHGPNMCPGWRLAMIQITQMLAVLLHDLPNNDLDTSDNGLPDDDDDLGMSESAYCAIM